MTAFDVNRGQAAVESEQDRRDHRKLPADDKKRSEMLAIADRMATLRDIDRIQQAEQMLRGARPSKEEARPGCR